MLEWRTVPLEQWDALVQQFPYYSIYNSSARLRYLTEGLGRTVSHEGVYEDSQLLGLLQTQLIPAKRGSFLYVQHSPLIKANLHGFYNEMHSRIQAIAQQEKATFIRLLTLLPEDDPHTASWKLATKESGYHRAPIQEVDACVTQQVPLAPAELMLQAMRKTTRYEIRQAEKDQQLTIEISSDWSQFDRFYRVHHTALSQKSYGSVPADYLAKELQHYAAAGMIQFAFAMKDGKDIATGVFITFGHFCTYYLGAIDPAYVKSRATYKILWRVMQWAQEKGLTTFELWGGMLSQKAQETNFKTQTSSFGFDISNLLFNKKHPWRGIHQFKEGFGGKTMYFQLPMDKTLSPRYWLTYGYEWWTNKRRGYL